MSTPEDPDPDCSDGCTTVLVMYSLMYFTTAIKPSARMRSARVTVAAVCLLRSRGPTRPEKAYEISKSLDFYSDFKLISK